MLSVFGACRVLGAPVPIAYAAQGLIGVLAITLAVFTVRKSRADAFNTAVVMAAATPLISPFLLVYDLAITAIPLSWLVVQGAQTGFRHWEKIVALLVFVLPFLSRTLTVTFNVPLAPLILILILAVVLRRLLTADDQSINAGAETKSLHSPLIQAQ
jgi:hypothetical protein